MESEGEEITPLKRRRKKKGKGGFVDAYSNQQHSTASTTTTTTSDNKNKITPTKKKNSITTKETYMPSTPDKHPLPYKDDLSNDTTTTDNLLSFKGIFCSANNKPDMMFFKPRGDQDATKDKLVHCPICHFNLQFLHGTTAQCHINQCLDAQPDFEQG